MLESCFILEKEPCRHAGSILIAENLMGRQCLWVEHFGLAMDCISERGTDAYGTLRFELQ